MRVPPSSGGEAHSSITTTRSQLYPLPHAIVPVPCDTGVSMTYATADSCLRKPPVSPFQRAGRDA